MQRLSEERLVKNQEDKTMVGGKEEDWNQDVVSRDIWIGPQTVRIENEGEQMNCLEWKKYLKRKTIGSRMACTKDGWWKERGRQMRLADEGKENLKWNLGRAGINSHEWVVFIEERGAWKELTKEAEEAMKWHGPHSMIEQWDEDEEEGWISVRETGNRGIIYCQRNTLD